MTNKLFNTLLSITRWVKYLKGIHKKNLLKETKSATMNIFRNFLFSFKSSVKVELSYVFTINLFTTAENCTEKWIIL